MSAPRPVLEVEGLAYARGPGREDFRLRLDRLSLAPGAFLAVAGESGCGKSTLLDLLGLVAAPSAVARFRLARPGGAPEEIAPLLAAGDLEAVAGLRREAIGYVLQQGGLLPFLTVAENIAITAPVGRPAPFSVAGLAERLGIAALLRRKPEAISIGQRQRVAIARAVMGDPALILADEPTAALDPPTARTTLGLLRALAAERGTAVVMASHSWGLIAEFDLPVLVARAEGGALPAMRFEPGRAQGLAA